MDNIHKRFNSKEMGFGLVEVLVSLSILTVVVLGFNFLSGVALRSWENAKNKSIAYNIIQDTFECTRNLRDINFNSPSYDWDDGVNTENIEDVCPTNTEAFNGFGRMIDIEDISENKKKITIDVSWQERGQEKSLKSITYLTEWRGRY